MEIKSIIEIVNEFKGKSLKEELNKIQDSKIIDGRNYNEIFDAGIKLKDVSRQIDEVIHASGILYVANQWLDTDETIKYLSLGAGNHKDKFDLETDKRIVEFKFGTWNSSSNGWRRRTWFSDYVGLVTHSDSRNREKFMVVEDKTGFEKFLSGNAECFNVLSKNPSKADDLKKYQDKHNKTFATVSDFREYTKDIVQILDVAYCTNKLKTK